MRLVFVDFKVDAFGVQQFGSIVVCSESLESIEQRSILINTDETDETPEGELPNPCPKFSMVCEEIYDILHGEIWVGHDINKTDFPSLKKAFEEIGEACPVPTYIIDTACFTSSGTTLANLAVNFGLGKRAGGSHENCLLNRHVIKQCGLVLSSYDQKDVCLQEQKEEQEKPEMVFHPMISHLLKFC